MRPALRPILAIDLGKCKRVACVDRSADDLRFLSIPGGVPAFKVVAGGFPAGNALPIAQEEQGQGRSRRIAT